MTSILCVDDEPTQLTLLRFAFERAGFIVLTAADGQEAIEMAEAHQPSIILMDLMMPVIDGSKTTTALKAIPALADIPVVLYTAYDQANMAKDALKAGAAAVIRKTTTPKSLVAQINDLLASYRNES